VGHSEARKPRSLKSGGWGLADVYAYGNNRNSVRSKQLYICVTTEFTGLCRAACLGNMT